MSEHTFDAVDLFAGPGGWDVAAHSLGLNVLGIEWDHAACETRRAAGLPTIEGDVRAYGPAVLPEVAGLIASPPCQTFSMAGNGAGRDALERVLSGVKALEEREIGDTSTLDERTALVLEPLRWALEALDLGTGYRWLAFEQVPAVLPVWEAMAYVLSSEGYTVDVDVLNAADYGVPQLRKRAVLVARWGVEVGLPAPTVDYTRAIEDVLPERTGWEMHHWRGAGMVERHGARPGRASSLPSMTITGHPSRLLWKRGGEVERLSVAEAAALQTFPDGYPWSGSSATTKFRQIGNAVPPLLAAAVLNAARGV